MDRAKKSEEVVVVWGAKIYLILIFLIKCQPSAPICVSWTAMMGYVSSGSQTYKLRVWFGFS